MTTPVFGRIDRPGDLNLEPFDFTIVGYRHDDDADEPVEVEFKFRASGVRPFYTQIEMVRAASSGSGLLSVNAIANFIERSLIDDEERQRWRDTLAAPDTHFSSDMLGELADWMGEQYAGRPTRPRTGSRSGQRSTGRKSPGAGTAKAGARTSASSRPRSR